MTKSDEKIKNFPKKKKKERNVKNAGPSPISTFQSKIRVAKLIQRTHHLNQQVKKKTYETEINRAAYHDELYLFDTILSI